MESVSGGESGRLGIILESSPSCELSESSAASIASLGEEGSEGEGDEEPVLLSLGVPAVLDFVEAVSDPPLQIDREEEGGGGGELVKS